MSARSHRRRAGANQRLFLIALGSVVLMGLLMLLAPMLVTRWLRGYLREDAFRARMEEFLGIQVRGSVELSSLHWSGDGVSSAGIRSKLANGWRAELGAPHLALDWNAFRRGTWRIINAGADDLTVRYEKPESAKAPALLGVADATTASQTADSMPAWLRSWLPAKTEIDGVGIDRFSLTHPGFGKGSWLLRGARLRVQPWSGETSVQFGLEGGIVDLPFNLPTRPAPLRLNLIRASGRLSRDQLILNEASLHWLEPAELIARGQIDFATERYDLTTFLSGLPLAECVSDDWRMRISGRLEGDLHVRGERGDPPVTDGDIKIREGVLTALPILDKLAAYTGVERFKRLVLDIATAQVRRAGDTDRFDQIVLQSNGLLRVEGSLIIRLQQLEGTFIIGVTPETLRWIPGAQQHVFTATNAKGPEGMIWTPMTISGTLDAPREDLSPRLLAGAGKAILDAPAKIVGQGTELLLSPVVGPEAAKTMPGEVIKGATDAVGKGIETGAKVLEGFSGGLLGK